MILHVMDRAREADVGRVVIACSEQEVADAVIADGGEAVMTDPDLPSGSDRVHAALQAIDPDGQHDVIVNLQGDLPTIEVSTTLAAVSPLENPAVDIATVTVEITREEEKTNPNVVKAVCAFKPGSTVTQALYFTRATAPTGDGPLYHHIGIYAYRREALERFVSLPPGILERRERLEQLRALEDGMRIDIALVDAAPLGVDTPEDLERARDALA
jgi:3-deoxy-manno-octulosonate cytidylyltransferase (CMP-KDO synthetase)